MIAPFAFVLAFLGLVDPSASPEAVLGFVKTIVGLASVAMIFSMIPSGGRASYENRLAPAQQRQQQLKKFLESNAPSGPVLSLGEAINGIAANQRQAIVDVNIVTQDSFARALAEIAATVDLPEGHSTIVIGWYDLTPKQVKDLLAAVPQKHRNNTTMVEIPDSPSFRSKEGIILEALLRAAAEKNRALEQLIKTSMADARLMVFSSVPLDLAGQLALSIIRLVALRDGQYSLQREISTAHMADTNA